MNGILKILKNKMFGEKMPIGSFDIVGSKEKSVAIIEIPKELEEKEKLIVEEIMKKHKSVKSVLKKVSGREGKFRTRKYMLIAGETDTEVIHKEYGYLLKLDPQKVYFSPREATERQRIASKVEQNETIMLMFSGVLPFGIAIFKKQPKVKKIIAVEINPDAVKYALENIRINRIPEGKIIPILGDVEEVCLKYFGSCDRVVMPLPLGAETYLDVAIKCLKKDGGIIHFYNWGKDDKPYEKAIKDIEDNCKKFKKKFEILEMRKVSQYAPKIWKVCIDFKIL